MTSQPETFSRSFTLARSIAVIYPLSLAVHMMLSIWRSPTNSTGAIIVVGVLALVAIGVTRLAIWARLAAEFLLLVGALLLPLIFAGYGLDSPEEGYEHPLETLFGISADASIYVGVGSGVLMSILLLWTMSQLNSGKSHFRAAFW